MSTDTGDILEYITDKLSTNFVDTGKIDYVDIRSPKETEVFFRSSEIPGMFVSSFGERMSNSKIANTTIIIHVIRIRLITLSLDRNKYRTKIVNNVYRLTNELREIIFKDKKLNGLVFEFGNKWIVKDVNILHAKSTIRYTARDVFINYHTLEAYTGRRNNQKSVELPEGLKFS